MDKETIDHKILTAKILRHLKNNPGSATDQLCEVFSDQDKTFKAVVHLMETGLIHASAPGDLIAIVKRAPPSCEPGEQMMMMKYKPLTYKATPKGIHVLELYDRMAAEYHALAQENKQVVDAMQALSEAMQLDPDYAWSWHCNIAMASVDEGMDQESANRAAARFMRLAFKADVSCYRPGVSKVN